VGEKERSKVTFGFKRKAGEEAMGSQLLQRKISWRILALVQVMHLRFRPAQDCLHSTAAVQAPVSFHPVA
jgi:hypothetical protein